MKLTAAVLLVLLATPLAAQQPVVQLTTEQDHQNMMDQLGIKRLRPGPSGDESAPNHANYDSALANPYPDLPDVLTLKNGRKVTSPETWWQQRRPEIVEDFEREVYGRVPANVPKVTWRVLVNEREFVGFTPVIARWLRTASSSVTRGSTCSRCALPLRVSVIGTGPGPTAAASCASAEGPTTPTAMPPTPTVLRKSRRLKPTSSFEDMNVPSARKSA